MFPAGEDVVKLTQGLSAIYGDLLMDIPSINVAGWHSSKSLSNFSCKIILKKCNSFGSSNESESERVKQCREYFRYLLSYGPFHQILKFRILQTKID